MPILGRLRCPSAAAAYPFPRWVRLEREILMQVDDYIRKSVVFLGMPEAHGFVGHGTGFLVAIDEGEHSFFYVISARHVVWPLWVEVKDGKPQGQIFVRVNRDTGVPKVFPVQRDEWIFHPDKEIDVCALPLDLHDDEDEHDGDKLDWSHIALPSMAHTHDKASWSGISLGDEVFVAGAFVNRLGVQKNIPIIRIVNIAAMPEKSIEFVSPKRPVYLVETRSLGGISGSPVFLKSSKRTCSRQKIVGTSCGNTYRQSR